MSARCAFPSFVLTLCVSASLAGCGGGKSASIASAPPTVNPAASNPVPVLASINPASGTVGSSGITLTATGQNFLSASVIYWNSAPVATSYASATKLTAQIPAGDLQNVANNMVTVVNPSPGGGTSNALTFVVNAPPTTTTGFRLNLPANDLAWDPVNQVIYLSLPSADGPNGNTVQVLHPAAPSLGASAYAGSEPNLLAVSKSSKYLYVSLNGASEVHRMTLPNLGTDITIPLGSSSISGPFFAMDLQAGPAYDGTVAIARGTPDSTPEEEGGVVIYDDATMRPDVLCGFIQIGCTTGLDGALYDSIQWNLDGSEMFAANNESSSFDFYTIPVTSAGFGMATDYPGLVGDSRGAFTGDIHYDPTTQYVYVDNGNVIDPVAGMLVGTFNSSGIMVPDGALGTAFFLGQTVATRGTATYTLESFDIRKLTPISTLAIPNVIGMPTHLIRWGADGLAFTTTSVGASSSTPAGAVYVVSGPFVSGTGAAARSAKPPAHNVQRTWKPVRMMQHVPSESELSHSFNQ